MPESLDNLPSNFPVDQEEWDFIVKASELSTQQTRVVELILSGKQNKESAAAMELSVHTIETYLKRIYARTNTDSRTNLAVHVLALGIQYLRSKIDK